MRHVLIVGLSIALLLSTASAWAEARIALVIGNSAYENLQPLRNPVNDVRLVAETLTEMGFEVAHPGNIDDPSVSPR